MNQQLHSARELTTKIKCKFIFLLPNRTTIFILFQVMLELDEKLTFDESVLTFYAMCDKLIRIYILLFYRMHTQHK